MASPYGEAFFCCGLAIFVLHYLGIGHKVFGQFLLIYPKCFSVLRGKLREKHYILVKKVVVATILLQKYSGGNSFLVWTKNSLLYSKYPKGKTNHVHLSILVKTDTFAQNLDNFSEDFTSDT